jgi:hypothetical protein
MRVGIDGKVLSHRIGGIGRYAIKLVEALLALRVQEYPDLELVIFTAPQMDRVILNGLRLASVNDFVGSEVPFSDRRLSSRRVWFSITSSAPQ